LFLILWNGGSGFGSSAIYLLRYDLQKTIISLTSALFWDLTQRTVAIPHRRCGTTYRSYFQGSRRIITFYS